MVIYLTLRNKNNYIILDKDGFEICLGDGFPIRWLYEDFEDELSTGIVKYSERTKGTNKGPATLVLDSIKKKLSKEELEYLGIKDSGTPYR